MHVSTMMSYVGGFLEAVEEIQALEKAGLHRVWVPEAYGFDAPSQMGYLAGKTTRVRIASGILPVYTRTPSLLAMTAAGVDALSGGRAMLGLGASGPQVIEGFHGVRYDAPVTRMGEVIEICRKVWKRERLIHEGAKYQIPLSADGPAGGSGLGKPLKMITHPVRDDIPIAIAALGQKSVEQTAEVADGWLPVFFHPGKVESIWGDALASGRSRRDPSRAPLEIFAGGAVGIGEGLEKLRDRGRDGIALYVGGMGAKKKNFYNDVFKSLGFENEAKQIQDLYLAGKKREAAAAVPGAFIEETTLIGPKGFVRERLAQYREAGVTSLNVSLVGHSIEERLATLHELNELIAGA
jgi:F420-dependent oxidoreductase-like protein